MSVVHADDALDDVVLVPRFRGSRSAEGSSERRRLGWRELGGPRPGRSPPAAAHPPDKWGIGACSARPSRSQSTKASARRSLGGWTSMIAPTNGSRVNGALLPTLRIGSHRRSCNGSTLRSCRRPLNPSPVSSSWPAFDDHREARGAAPSLGESQQ